jgi:GTPase SAR1 family protein
MSDATSSSSSSAPEVDVDAQNATPTVCLVIGMAGSGKSTLMQRMCAHTFAKDMSPYVINLDPAVYGKLRFQSHVDVRQSIDYQKVMSQYELGPNGAIMTCLNLFGTRMPELMELVAKRTETDKKMRHIWVDTPGQIEVFTWSASGSLITQVFASQLPTCILFVVDGQRARESPNTFMSNMLYACSIMYKTQLPMCVVFNKCDLVSDADVLKQWMTDAALFQEALQEDTEAKSTYFTDLSYSLSLVLDSFYENIRSCAVSAVTGEGVDQLLVEIEACKKEFFESYKAGLDKNRAENLRRLEQDLARATTDDMDPTGAMERAQAVVDSVALDRDDDDKTTAASGGRQFRILRGADGYQDPDYESDGDGERYEGAVMYDDEEDA